MDEQKNEFVYELQQAVHYLKNNNSRLTSGLFSFFKKNKISEKGEKVFHRHWGVAALLNAHDP